MIFQVSHTRRVIHDMHECEILRQIWRQSPFKHSTATQSPCR